MLVQIDENWATLTPFGSLALNAPTAETKSWSKLLRSVFSQTRQKRSDEISAELQVNAPILLRLALRSDRHGFPPVARCPVRVPQVPLMLVPLEIADRRLISERGTRPSKKQTRGPIYRMRRYRLKQKTGESGYVAR